MLLMGMRLGDEPRIVATTTPKNVPLVRRLLAESTTRTVSGTTHENADNLAATFLTKVVARYEGTDLGEQELYGRLLLEDKDALWTREMLSTTRVRPGEITVDDMSSIVVAVDPAVSVSDKSDETGIVVTGKCRKGHGYVLADLSGKYTPQGWAKVALQAYVQYGATRIVAEVNNGGDMVRHTIRTYDRDGLTGQNVPVRSVRASRGKWTRAEPIASLWQQQRCHMIGVHRQLEEQLTTFSPMEGGKSPDRFDAMVWGMTDLMLREGARWFA